MSPSRFLVAIVVLAPAAAAFSGAPGALEAGIRFEALVVGASGAHLEARGFDVVDDYGGAATALLTAGDAGTLMREGLSVSPLDRTTGRGSHRFDARAGDGAVPTELRAAPAAAGAYLVAFRGPIKEAWREDLESRVLRIHDYLPHHTYLVEATRDAARGLAAKEEVAFVGVYHPAYKLSPDLARTGVQEITVLAFAGGPLGPLAATLTLLGADVRGFADVGIDGVLRVALPTERLVDVARLPQVSWIEPAYAEASFDNAEASAITQTGAGGGYRVHDKGVDGSSQRISACDSGVDTTTPTPSRVPDAVPRPIEPIHETFADPSFPFTFYNTENPIPLPLPVRIVPEHRKIVLYYAPTEEGEPIGDSDDGVGHGTHTAGTIAGDAPDGAVLGTRNKQDGVAFNAKLVVCDIAIAGGGPAVLTDYAGYWKPAYDAGARINGNAWGSAPYTRTYTDKARQHDAYVNEHRDFLILRSAGNVAGTLRPEANAKSAVAVGATDNLPLDVGDVAAFSGDGPSADGRIKPNFVAPGNCLDSAVGGTKNRYSCEAGTSMSTAAITGAAGLVRDYFVKGYYPTGKPSDADKLQPSAALVRAVLQISGREMAGARAAATIPNGVEGWGRVTLDDALFFEGDARRLHVLDEGDGLATGGTKELTLAVGAGAPLRVMIAWSDAPGAAGASPALVNDLDLVVRDPSGNVHRGNAFQGGTVPPNSGTRDLLNVEEAVYVAEPAPGTWTLTVSGANVPQGPQTFALVATFA